MKLGPHTYLYTTSGKLSTPFFFPLILLRSSFSFCWQTWISVSSCSGKRLSWVTHEASAGPCLAQGGSCHSSALPRATKGPHLHPPWWVAQPAVQLRGFARCSHAVHPHVGAFCIPSCLSKCKNSGDSLSISITSGCLECSVYTRQAKRGCPAVQGNRGYFCLEWLLSQGRKAGGIQEEQLHIKG